MNETAIAFELPHARANATHAGPMPDRISVRDYIRSAEIGAFRPEHGVEQRLRFNVVLEVSPHDAAQSDDVDQVISYDSITAAIDEALESDRVDLLETLSEHVAADCLSDPRALRVFVRVEKLDRIPGALGVEIVRTRERMAEQLADTGDADNLPAGQVRPAVVYVPHRVIENSDTNGWLSTLAAWSRPCILCISAADPQPVPQTGRQKRIGLLAIEQAGLIIADREPAFEVVETRTELDWALKNGRHSIWAPARMIEAAHETVTSGADDPAALAAWLASEIEGDLFLVADPDDSDTPTGAVVLDPSAPDALEKYSTPAERG